MSRKIAANLFICVKKPHKAIQIWVVIYDKFHILFISQIYIFFTTNYEKDIKFD